MAAHHFRKPLQYSVECVRFTIISTGNYNRIKLFIFYLILTQRLCYRRTIQNSWRHFNEINKLFFRINRIWKYTLIDNNRAKIKILLGPR